MWRKGRRVSPLSLHLGGAVLFLYANAALNLLDIKHHPVPLFRDGFEGVFECVVIPHALGAEDIGEEVLTLHPHKGRLGVEGPHTQGKVLTVVEDAAEEVEVEGAEFRFKGFGQEVLDEAVAGVAVFDKVCNRDEFETVFFLETQEVGKAGEGTVLVQDFANHAGGAQSGKLGEVNRRFAAKTMEVYEPGDVIWP